LLALVVEGTSEISTPPRIGGPASIPHTQSVYKYVCILCVFVSYCRYVVLLCAQWGGLDLMWLKP